MSLLDSTSALFSDLTAFQLFLCPGCHKPISLNALVLHISSASPQKLCMEGSFLTFSSNLCITSSEIPSPTLPCQWEPLSLETGMITLSGCLTYSYYHLYHPFTKFLPNAVASPKLWWPGQSYALGLRQIDTRCRSFPLPDPELHLWASPPLPSLHLHLHSSTSRFYLH